MESNLTAFDTFVMEQKMQEKPQQQSAIYSMSFKP